MGQAEQRQVASGAAARVREQAERARVLDGRLAEIDFGAPAHEWDDEADEPESQP
jgi:hypothetical protein